jgi:hypothetical protein
MLLSFVILYFHICRYDGTKLRSSTASTQIGLFCSEYFGIFLNVTSLRAINNTAVQNAAALGHINDNQLDDYNRGCQGHNTRMGKKAYDYSREQDRAKTLQKITDLINNKCRDNADSDVEISSEGSDDEAISSGEGSVSDSGGRRRGDICREKRKRKEDNRSNAINILNKKKKLSGDEQLQVKHIGDWGKKHPCYNTNALKIKWSPFEKDYIQSMFDKHPHKHNVWRHCLDSILNTNDENVRHQFHVTHLTVVKLKDAIRVRKID